MKKVLISSFDMEIGGVERSLISMLDNFDYDNYDVDLMLYSHSGDLMKLLSKKPKLLEEFKEYKTFRMSIAQIIKSGNWRIGLSRLRAKFKTKIISKRYRVKENVYIQMQYMWEYSLPYLPSMDKEYDIAISYLWPHYFIAEKVKAKTKIAWIHTDYSTVHTDTDMDFKIWNKFDYIVSISEDCTDAFVSKYPKLKDKIILVENITSPNFVRIMAEEKIENLIFNKEKFNIVSVGRLCHQKGFDNAIKALRLLHDRGYNDINWYIVGYGQDEEILKRLIIENNLIENFILLGKKSNPYPYMKNCDIYVQPSRYEGKAVTITEAQILEKPVLLTNYATAQSQLKDGLDGYITELSIEGIADGIEKLYKENELRKKLSYNCSNINYGNAYELEKLYKIMNLESNQLVK